MEMAVCKFGQFSMGTLTSRLGCSEAWFLSRNHCYI